MSVKTVIHKALVVAAEEGLTSCTEQQRTFFVKLFPGKIEALSEEKLRNALALIERTVEKNTRSGQVKPDQTGPK